MSHPGRIRVTQLMRFVKFFQCMLKILAGMANRVVVNGIQFPSQYGRNSDSLCQKDMRHFGLFVDTGSFMGWKKTA